MSPEDAPSNSNTSHYGTPMHHGMRLARQEFQVRIRPGFVTPPAACWMYVGAVTEGPISGSHSAFVTARICSRSAGSRSRTRPCATSIIGPKRFTQPRICTNAVGNRMRPGILTKSYEENQLHRISVPARGHTSGDLARTAAIVATGCSSISQCPEPAMTTSCTSVAAARITTAMVGPKDFSPPIASTGMVSMP